jgi:aminoglycoside phosphotransferase (APT) family kinase protein
MKSSPITGGMLEKELCLPATKMHADEVATDAALVRRLLAAQFPQWADLPIAPVASAGTDNALYRIGDALVVRLPRIAGATGQVDKDHRWLPRLAPHLPLAIPAPLAKGEPGEGYPYPWAICQWLAGENATFDRLADPRQAATDLARFIAALQRIDATGVRGNLGSRGVLLATRDAYTRAAIADAHNLGLIDTDAVLAAWEAALQAPTWDRPPVWLHGDLQSGNLLATDGRLSAVIDFGCLNVGDPAADVMAAWLYLPAEVREDFRAALGVDDATWARGRGWALSVSIVALPYYHITNPVLAGISRHAIEEVLADHRRGA